MALFTVELRNTIVVEAEDTSHAYSVARDHRIAASMDGDADVSVIGVVAAVRELPGGWDERCMPYGGKGLTVGEILGS